MKIRSSHKYAIFKIENNKKIVIDYTSEPKETETKEDDRTWFEKLKEKLGDEPRYILYDFGFEDNFIIIKKLVFIFW